MSVLLLTLSALLFLPLYYHTKIKPILILIVSIIFFFYQVNFDINIVTSLFIFLSFGYLTLKTGFTKSGTVIFVIIWYLLKSKSFIPDNWIFDLGISWFVFRQIGLAYSLTPCPRLSFTRYLSYMLYFPTLFAGPYLAPHKFFNQLDSINTISGFKTDLNGQIDRILFGVFKVLAISPTIVIGFEHLPDSLPMFQALKMMTYTLNLYIQFAGFMDISIGFSSLLGIELPENFNHPFKSSSFKEFWTRWHITISNWFRLYIFNQLLHKTYELKPNSINSKWPYIFPTLTTFIIMGLWHHPNVSYLFFGIYLALAIIFENICGKLFKNLTPANLRIFLGRVWVTSIFCFCISCFWLTENTFVSSQILDTIPWLVLFSVIAQFILLLTETTKSILHVIPNPIIYAFSVFIILLIQFELVNPVPTFIYANF
jgi:D-alanyl-lipoteichoic acid acyltransferase DltB (MBOAT superfamily)